MKKHKSLDLFAICVVAFLFALGCSMGRSPETTNTNPSNSSNQGGGNTAQPTPSVSTTTNVSPQLSPSGGNVWSQTAVTYRGRNGEQINITCSPNGQSRSVWGTDVYSDDSSVCTAAVHAGLITLAQGGRVTIEIRPGQPAYAGSPRNGVTSSSYGRWSGSFAFVRPR